MEQVDEADCRYYAEQVSSGLGMLVLHAAKMAAGGSRASQICADIEKVKAHIQTGYIFAGTDYLHKRGVLVYMQPICAIPLSLALIW